MNDAGAIYPVLPIYFTRYGIRVAMLHERGFGVGKARRQRTHAVPTTGRALCGYAPSFEWSGPEDQPPTCPKCLKKLKKMANS